MMADYHDAGAWEAAARAMTVEVLETGDTETLVDLVV
jgi:hypothetical protein